MKESRRGFVKTSIAFGTLIVTKAIAQPGSPAAVSKKKIGFLVSTKDRNKHDSAFIQALNADNWTNSNMAVYYRHADDDYAGVKNLVLQHIANKVDLIVAAGGLPTAVAVASVINGNINNNKPASPFIYLIGRYPASNTGVDAAAADLFNCPTTKKVGGLDQAVPAQNGANFQLLKSKSGGGVTIDKVGLIVNDNNPITLPEIDAWINLTDPADPTKSINSAFIYHLTANNQAQGMVGLLTTIRTASTQPNGIVVSSDAYLREVGNVDFDAQLRDTTANSGGHFLGWVCYPYEEYVLTSANSIWSETTPVLATDDPTYIDAAYYKLGGKAAKILDQLVANQPLNANVSTWNGSQWIPPT
jgi:hypothetical protein